MGGFRGVGDGDLGVLGGGWVYNASSMPKPPIVRQTDRQKNSRIESQIEKERNTEKEGDRQKDRWAARDVELGRQTERRFAEGRKPTGNRGTNRKSNEQTEKETAGERHRHRIKE